MPQQRVILILQVTISRLPKAGEERIDSLTTMV